MSQIDRELNEVWDALRASRGQRDEALEEVRITNLRAIDDLRIPFDYPVSVLAGPNGSGKSTVLFACACAYRVPGRRSGHFAPGRLFPNFTSRQEAVRSDPVPETQLEFHYLHDDEVAEGVIRGVLEGLNIEMGLRHEDIVVGRNTGRDEFPGHVRTLAKFGKLSDFILVLDGDSREMENDLKAVAGEYGHALQPLFLPGDASPEQWLWGILRIRPGEYADAFGLAEADMRHKTDRVEHLVEGAVQQRDAAKTCLRAFADDIRRTVPEIARNVGRNEAKNNEIPELLHALKDQIIRWRRF